MDNRSRFTNVMSGKKPDITPFLIFSELLPGDIYKSVLLDKGVGLIVHAGSVKPVFNYNMNHEVANNVRKMTVFTPYGNCYAEYLLGNSRISGNGEIQKSYLVKEPADYQKVVYMLDNSDFIIDRLDYDQVLEVLGVNGVTHTWCDEPPYMGLQYLLGFEKWCLDQYDCPDDFAVLLSAYERMQTRRMSKQLIAPEKDLICVGNLSGNYSPDNYTRFTKPYFDKWGSRLAAAGCSVTVHADALNLSRHIDVFPSDGISVVEAFTPPPTGDLSLANARKKWGEEIVFHLNVPEAIFYHGKDFVYNWTKELLQSDPNPRRFLSFTENGLLGTEGRQKEMYMAGIMAIIDAMHKY